MKKQLLTLILFQLVASLSYSQNTIGTVLNTEDAYNGYTLFTSANETYLINNCGEVINQWTSTFPPGNAVYLLEDGSLLRACRINNPNFNFGGSGGRIEKYNWEGNLIWEYDYSSTTILQHHDVFPMPNGNVLVLAVTEMTNAQAIQAGRNPALLTEGTLYNEQVVELQPVGSNNATIVWQWDAKDHLIQDFDITKNNFGVVENSPERLDVNFLNGGGGNKNWLHVNSMQYDAALDQIVLSSRNLSELWIIDHSTTTQEAASSLGGTYGKGGDFLYRWGTPQAYKQGTEVDRKLFGQHYPHFIPNGLLDAGKIIIFNNGNGRTPLYSEVDIINPPTTSPGVYTYTPNTAYGPIAPDFIYSDLSNTPSDFYSAIVSSAQRLPNDNILICEGRDGRFFEIDDTNSIVWEYVNPVDTNNGFIHTQGDHPTTNLTFRAIKYAPDYPAFTGRDLTPGNPIELNPDLSDCNNLGVTDLSISNLKIYPNPTTSFVTINSTSIIDKIDVYNLLGSKIHTTTNTNTLDLSKYNSGIYTLKIHSGNQFVNKKIIKH